MRTERQSATRLLQLAMIASLVLPAALFAYAAWSDYREVSAVANERIARSLDVLQEQALKVFETVDRIFPEVDEVVRGMSDTQIRAAQSTLVSRLQRIATVMPEVQSIALIDDTGRLLASSAPGEESAVALRSERNYFKVQGGHDAGTYVGTVHRAPSPGAKGGSFILSRRLEPADAPFKGVIAVAVRLQYFENFYALIEQSPGSFYGLVRSDGQLLVRYPAGRDDPGQLEPASAVRKAIGNGAVRGLFLADSEIESVPRRIGLRKVGDYPVYALAATDTAAIRAAWFAKLAAHLLFGLPATLVLFAVLWVALRRTRRLHDEAEGRETAVRALRQAQQLQAIGQLTGGVAHDFNNLLMIVGGSVQRLRRSISEDGQLRLLDAITNATQRGESLTRQLLTFSRRQMLQPSVIDLAERLPEIKDMLSRSLRGDIEMRVVASKRLCCVKVDPNEFELALLNLAVNARDAMPSGGTLTITAKPVVLRGKAREEELSGEFIAIRVADNGAGIPADILPRVFEPFFTTKDIDKGTGLGLSQVYGFAKQSGGTATITSSPRRGTAVTLFLPRSREMPAQKRSPSETAAIAPRGSTVLLVEDNAEVAEVTKAYLEQLGYQVKQAAAAAAGLALLERDGSIDLVFSDILMPGGMTGLELAAAVRGRFPNVLLLLTTGYSSSAHEAVREGFAVLQKPYDLAGLQRALREVHDSAERARQSAPRQAVG